VEKVKCLCWSCIVFPVCDKVCDKHLDFLARTKHRDDNRQVRVFCNDFGRGLLRDYRNVELSQLVCVVEAI